ncbi:MAG: hypothetical protein ABJ327_19345 [Litoreibacter sp.]
MAIENNIEDVRNLDFAAIELEARQLRADVVRDMIKSVAAFFSGLSFGNTTKNAEV